MPELVEDTGRDHDRIGENFAPKTLVSTILLMVYRFVVDD